MRTMRSATCGPVETVCFLFEIGYLSRFWLFSLCPLVFLRTTTFKLLSFPTFRLREYPMKDVPKMRNKFDIYVFINTIHAYVLHTRSAI